MLAECKPTYRENSSSMFAAIRVLFFAFFDICRFRKRPQDIPKSNNLLVSCIFSYAVISTALVGMAESIDRAMLSGITEIVVLSVFSLLLLQISGKAMRWIQTLTALSGTGVVLSIIALPVYFFLSTSGTDDSTNEPLYQMFLLMLAALAFWNIAVMAHILKHALEVSTVISILLAISYIWIILTLSTALFPSESG